MGQMAQMGPQTQGTHNISNLLANSMGGQKNHGPPTMATSKLAGLMNSQVNGPQSRLGKPRQQNSQLGNMAKFLQKKGGLNPSQQQQQQQPTGRRGPSLENMISQASNAKKFGNKMNHLAGMNNKNQQQAQQQQMQQNRFQNSNQFSNSGSNFQNSRSQIGGNMPMQRQGQQFNSAVIHFPFIYLKKS